MDQNELDQIFRTSLEDHKTTIDKNQLWEAINQEQRRKGFQLSFLKTLAVLLLLGITSTLLFNMFSDTEDPATSVQAPISAKETKLEKNLPVASTKIGNTIKHTEALNSIREPSTKQSETSKTSTDYKIRTSNSSDNRTQFNKPLKNAYTSKQLEKNHIDFSKHNSQSTPFKEKADLNKSTGLTLVSELKRERVSTFENLSLLNSQLISSGQSVKRNNSSIECYDHKEKVDPFYLEIYSTVDYVKNRFTNIGTQEFNYLNERKATQTQLEGYRAGFRLKYLTRSGLYLKTGIELGAIRERFNRTTTTERTEVLPNQLLEVITKVDTTIFIYGDKPVTVIEEKNWKVWNTYRTVGVPLLVGFQKDLGRLTYGIEFGAIYNLLYNFEGMILDSSLTPVNNIDYFKSNINTSLTGGFNIGFRLNPKFSILSYASFKHNLSTINNSDNPISQANTKVGLGLGLEMKL